MLLRSQQGKHQKRARQRGAGTEVNQIRKFTATPGIGQVWDHGQLLSSSVSTKALKVTELLERSVGWVLRPCSHAEGAEQQLKPQPCTQAACAPKPRFRGKPSLSSIHSHGHSWWDF